MPHDPVCFPQHYLQSGNPYLAISIHERLPFNLACVSKYLWRFKDKNGAEDLAKAKWFLARERGRVDGMGWWHRMFYQLHLRWIIETLPDEGVPWRCRAALEYFHRGIDLKVLEIIDDAKELLPA